MCAERFVTLSMFVHPAVANASNALFIRVRLIYRYICIKYILRVNQRTVFGYPLVPVSSAHTLPL